MTRADAFPLTDRRRLLGSAAGLALAATGLTGCDRLAPQQPITIAAHLWQGYEPLFMAERQQWLDARQARLVLTGSASESLKALAAGQVDGAALTLDEVLRARADGQPLVIVMVFDVSAGADKLLLRPPGRTLADLKGHAIAYEAGAVGELMLSEALRAAGLSRADVRPVPMPVDRQLEAWDRGLADGFVTYEPMASRLAARGAREVFDSRRMPNLIVDVLAVRPQVLNGSQAGAVRHVIEAHFRSLDHFRTHPQDAVHRMAGHLQLPPAEVLKAFRGLLLPNRDGNQRLLGGERPELAAGARRVRALLVELGLVSGNDDLANLLRADFLPDTPVEP